MKEMISKMNDITAVLHGAIDESSAKSAADKLKDMVTDMNKLEAQDQALPKTTPDEDKALQDKYGKDMQTAQENLAGEMARIEMNPTLAAPIDDAMKGFQPQGQ
jgi:predicted oxidoreductase